MASALRADVVETAAGGPVALTKQHAAKVWAGYTFPGAVPTLQGSFNITSVTDVAVGRCTLNLTNAFFGTSYYAAEGGGEETTAVVNVYRESLSSASTIHFYTLNSAFATVDSATKVSSSAFGTLA